MIYKLSNEEFMALLRLNAVIKSDDTYRHCVRWQMKPGSSVYAHRGNEGFSYYAATGEAAVKFCTQLLGRHTKLNGHKHKQWYIYDIQREVA